MEELKKSESNIIKFIEDSLKGSKINYVNGELPVMHEMRSLTKTSPPTLSFIKSKPNPILPIFKLLGVLLLLFLLYKLIIVYFPTILDSLKPQIKKIKNKVDDLMGIVKKDIVKIETKLNPMFNTRNNLNSNQILDYLLNTRKQSDQWCFVGESNKKRYCTLMKGEECMSGNIFPSKDICVNPKLKV